MYRFSINTPADLRVNSHYGYAKSLSGIRDSLRNTKIDGRGVIVEHNSQRARVQMHYAPHPTPESHYPHQFKIYMSQVESTLFEDHKVEAYLQADEFWTANQWGRMAALRSGIPDDKVYVYNHGLFSNDYPEKLRGEGDKIRFLHIDSGSPRKRADLVEKAFRVLHEKNKNIELTLKYSHFPHKGPCEPGTGTVCSVFLGPEKGDSENSHYCGLTWSNPLKLKNAGEWVAPGIRHIKETLSQKDLISLMHFHDVLVYPSEGEGFGLIPLEALATGMPVISTHEWADYAGHFNEGHLESKISSSKTDWGYYKKGDVIVPDFDSIVDKMDFFASNMPSLSGLYLDRAKEVREEYDWNKVTHDFFSGFFRRSPSELFLRSR